MAYCYAKLHNKYGDFGLFRISGTGLGNLLFPWARSIVAARKYGVTPIWPTWPQINTAKRLDRFLEYSKQHYATLFKRPDDYVGSLAKLRLLVRGKKISESEIDRVILSKRTGEEIVVFEGMATLFADILEDHQLVREELIRMTRATHLKALGLEMAGAIVVHVRLGDFQVSRDLGVLESGVYNYRLPMQWYCDQVVQLRSVMGARTPVYVFSDGAKSYLIDLLSLGHTKYIELGSAISDLLALSKAEVLVASASTYSMWASYLGRMPVIWYRGQRRQQLYYEDPRAEVEVRLTEPLPSAFLDRIRRTGVGKSQASG